MGTFLLSEERNLQEWYCTDFEYDIYWIEDDNLWYSETIPLPKVEVRHFIENVLFGDVKIKCDKIVKRTHKSAWDTSGSSSLEYYVFSFEHEEDAVAFKLKYSHIVDEKEIEKLKNKKTTYEKKRDKVISKGEYWKDRRDY